MKFFDYFTDGARRALQSAEAEAQRMGHQVLGTEHLLLGLLHDRDVAATLDRLGAPPATVRKLLEDIVDIDPHGRQSPAGPIPWNARAARTIEEIVPREVKNAGLNYIGPAHLLLGLIREGDGIAAHVLARLGVDLARARRHVQQGRGDQ